MKKNKKKNGPRKFASSHAEDAVSVNRCAQDCGSPFVTKLELAALEGRGLITTLVPCVKRTLNNY